MIYNLHIASLSLFTKKEIIACDFQEAKEIAIEKMLQLSMLSNEEILFSFEGEGKLYNTSTIKKEKEKERKKKEEEINKLEMITV